MPNQTDPIQPVGEIIRSVANRLLEHPNSRAQGLWKYWHHIFGDPIARHTEPVRLTNGVLVIRVDLSTWMTQLTFLKPEILDKIQQLLPPGSVREIRLQQGSLRSRGQQASRYQYQPGPALPPASEQEQLKAEQACATVQDETLRRTLYRLLVTHQVYQRSFSDTQVSPQVSH
ncbi:MAG: DUF721 domain-containing protein [Magnetococcales bacterium]|nr:DUF721 domain-containing protein [Magnetococcales bacterium]